MSKTSNKKPDGSPSPTLRSKKSINIIREKIQQRHLFEARRLFQESAPNIEKNERDTLGEQIPTLIEQAREYFSEGGNHEKERELEQARQKYEKVKTIATDYPGLSESLRRVDDAMELIWALENSANRRKGGKSKQSFRLTTTSKSRKSRKWWILSLCFFLQLALIGAWLFHKNNLNFKPIKQYNSRPVKQYDQSKPSEPPSSSLKVNYRPEDTETSKKKSPELQKEVTKDLAGAGSGQARSTIPLNQQQKETAAILPDRKTSSETLYTVQKNDTLGLISQKKYGTVLQWPTIANANKDQLGDNPNRLKVGMILIIPTIDE